jgi:hypothetical protein
VWDQVVTFPEVVQRLVQPLNGVEEISERAFPGVPVSSSNALHAKEEASIGTVFQLVHHVFH